MNTKQLVCNDCGCRFEIKNAKEPASQSAKTERMTDKSGESKNGTLSLSCPECRSYNVTTA